MELAKELTEADQSHCRQIPKDTGAGYPVFYDWERGIGDPEIE